MKVAALGAVALSLTSVSALGADLGLPPPVVPLGFTWTDATRVDRLPAVLGKRTSTIRLGLPHLSPASLQQT